MTGIRQVVSLASIFFIPLLLSGPSFSAPINPGFELGLTGWTASTSVLVGIEFQGYLPTEGLAMAIVSGNDLDATDAESFFGLPSGTILSNAPDTFAGAGLFQTFTLAEAGTLSFDWNFRDSGDGFGDYGYWVIGDEFNILLQNQSSTDWQTLTTAVLGPGTVRIGFGMFNSIDGISSPAILIDNLQFTAESNVPEPSSGSLAVAALVLGSILRSVRTCKAHR
jgi:hypothetical protein